MADKQKQDESPRFGDCLIRRRPVQVTDVADIRPDTSVGPFFLKVNAQVSNVALTSWIVGQKKSLKSQLTKYGAILFRGFSVRDMCAFSTFVREMCGEPLDYHERSSPRSMIHAGIYTSTDYPADQTIYFHNENSYQHSWPQQVTLYCVEAARAGGETPLSDIREVTRNISPAILRRFREKGVLYQRNYGPLLGLPWETAFQTADREEVNRYCRHAGMEVEWLGADRLRTRQVRRALVRHTETDEELWFNHAAFFHVSTLPPTIREALLGALREEDLPSNSYYGDGTPIEDAVLRHIRTAYEEASGMFTWQAGDVLVLDNMLVAHARKAYEGNRKIVVSMTNAVRGYWCELQLTSE
jgi:alpha-ketoglutarate-dependent taurine dioxygenase